MNTMNTKSRTGLTTALLTAALLLAAPAPARQDANQQPVRVCATTQDLGSLASLIGGDQVAVTTFARGKEDAHFVEPRPSFVVALRRADLLLVQGFGLEEGWLPTLLGRARNPRVLLGAAGYFDASRFVRPLGEVKGVSDRSGGDVHPYGNPHYTTDPARMIVLARKLRDRFASERPAAAKAFAKRYEALHARMGQAMFGKLAEEYDWEKLALLLEGGKLQPFLEKAKKTDLLGGWAKELSGLRGKAFVVEHDAWIYFAQRFGLRVVAFLEPRPGVSPSSSHLASVLAKIKSQDVRVIATVSYFDPKHARFLAERSGASVVPVAHQVGSREGCDDIVSVIDYNVRAIAKALR